MSSEKRQRSRDRTSLNVSEEDYRSAKFFITYLRYGYPQVKSGFIPDWNIVVELGEEFCERTLYHLAKNDPQRFEMLKYEDIWYYRAKYKNPTSDLTLDPDPSDWTNHKPNAAGSWRERIKKSYWTSNNEEEDADDNDSNVEMEEKSDPLDGSLDDYSSKTTDWSDYHKNIKKQGKLKKPMSGKEGLNTSLDNWASSGWIDYSSTKKSKEDYESDDWKYKKVGNQNFGNTNTTDHAESSTSDDTGGLLIDEGYNDNVIEEEVAQEGEVNTVEDNGWINYG